MARERQTTVIDGYRYEMTMLGATAGYRLFFKLLTMFGPSFGDMMDAAGGGDIQDVDLSSSAAVRGIKSLTTNVSESDLDHVIEQLRSQTHVSVEKGSEKTVPLSKVFEMHFMGELNSMFKWLWWGLKVQYQTFSGAFANLMPPSEGGKVPAATTEKR